LQIKGLVESGVLTVALLLFGEHRQVLSWQLLQFLFEVVMIIRIFTDYLALPHVGEAFIKTA